MSTSNFKFVPATFFTSPFCPYAQRVSIALLESGLIDSIQPKEYPSGVTITEIDLRNKPEWYTRDVNPKGKVPAFQITLPGSQRHILVESDLVAQFVLIAQPSSPLLTWTQPYLHYRAQSFAAQFQAWPTAYYTLLRAKQPEAAQEATAALLALARTLVDALDPMGPFSLGPTFLWPDLLAASFLTRIPVLHHYRAFAIPDTAEFRRFHTWIAACTALPSVQKSTAPLYQIIQAYIFIAT